MSINRLTVSALIALPLLAMPAAARPQDTRPTAPPAVELNEQEQAVVDWLKEAATPLETAEAGNGLEDMQPIRELIGEARLVSLGESTHGTREIFQMKHRMLEFLVTEMGFTLFGIEASMPDCIAINEYVLTGQGNVRTAVAGQGFWTWNTDEVVEMVEWMRVYNADPANAGKPKLKFYGYDMQNPSSAVAITLKFLEKVDPDAAKVFAPRLQTEAMNLQQFDQTDKANIEATGKALEEAAAYLDERAAAFTGQTSRDEYAMARRCVVVAQQGLEMMEQMRGQASSPQRQQLFMRLPGQVRELETFLKVHPDIGSEEARTLVGDIAKLEMFASRYMAADTTDEQRQKWATLAAELEEAVKAATADDPAGAAARSQAADVVAVFEALKSIPRQGSGGTQNIRDRSMAENIRWILEHEGQEAKIVLWAHNGHVSVTPGDPEKTFAAMGSYLEKWFGDDHIPVGFAFGKGSFQAVAGRPEIVPPNTVGLPEWTVDWAKPGSMDRICAAAGLPFFIADLRDADGDAKHWLATPHPWRSIGALFDPAAEDNFYQVIAPSFAFEAVIYIESTTRARPSMGFGPQAMGQRPRLGIQFGPAEEGVSGAMINQVIEGTPAEAAGLKVGDRIIRVGEDEIADIAAFQQALRPALLKETVRFTIVRDGEEIEVEVKLEPAE